MSGTPSSDGLLREGDVIEIKRGHTVYVDLPAHFVYSNRRGCFDELAQTEVKIGERKNGMDTDWLIGRYVVTATSFSGGGFGMGAHDEYPDGHHVKAEQLAPKGDISAIGWHRARVSFYQTGCFTAMIRDIRPVGRAKAHWDVA